ncbi:transcriptional regulator [Sphingomonas sp. PAMC 26621]|uniref:transcriptional regulator n=1 Tax=Sphingomonas sp. PAMC 26621 TaxID=1112213 RepID=UPI0002885250|nr:transcriptional regulator [Sphingomonas sp. PAMC 26621]
MLVFLDFEASSLAKKSYPIEVAWVFEDGRSESHLIRPAPEWTDWDDAAEAIHHIPRATLIAEGTSHDVVAARMLQELAGHDLRATAPSWDGKWLSALLRAAGIDRHSLRLRDSDDARSESVAAILARVVPASDLAIAVADLVALEDLRANDGPPAHRALPDAVEDQQRWRAACAAAERFVTERSA